MFELDGRTYAGIYAGSETVDGVVRHLARNVQDVGPSGPGNLVGTAAQSPSPDVSASNSQAIPRSADSKVLGGALSSASIAAGFRAMYRLAFVSPQLDRELSTARAELNAAAAARSGAVDRYSMTIDQNVQDARQALQALRSEISDAHVEAPKIAAEQHNVSLRFDVADVGTQLRMASAYYTATSAAAQSPIHKISKAMCLAGVGLANELGDHDALAQNGVLTVAESFARFLRSTTDLLLGVDPITGLVRDTVELLIGTNIVTGETLSDTERALRAVMAGVNLVTLGASGTVEGGVRTLSRVAERAAGAGASRAREVFVIADGLPFTRHGWERFSSLPAGSRKWMQRLFENEQGAELTTDWVRKTIEEATPYWDRAEETIAFHSKHDAADFWLRVAIDKKPDSVIVTIIGRETPFDLNVLLEDKITPRFVPYEEKVPNLFTLPP